MTYSFPTQRPKSFDDAVRIYNEIKPIKGAKAPYDIRPLGRRGNHAERIIKIDDNNYALWPSSHWWIDDKAVDKEEARIRAAILWERTDKGDFVHVRNGWRNAANVSHFRFLYETLPHNLSFVTQNGKQHIIQYVKGVRISHYIPKDSWMGGSYDKAFKNVDEEGSLTPELVFKYEGNEQFTLVSKAFVAPRKVVDTETKAELRDSIKAFRDWAFTMAPMLNLKPSWSWPYTKREEALNTAYIAQKRNDEETIAQWGLANGYGKIYHLPPNINRQIVQNDQHPLRVAMANSILNACDLRRIEKNVEEGKSTPKEARTALLNAFNYHMNQVLGLVSEK